MRHMSSSARAVNDCDAGRRLVESGVEFQSPGNTYIDDASSIEPGVWIGAGCHITGSHIKAGSSLGPNAIVEASVIGERVVIAPFSIVAGNSELENDAQIKPRSEVRASRIGIRAEIGANAIVEFSRVNTLAKVGPFCRVRAGSEICQDAYIGTQAEVKASRIGPGSKMGHFSLMADADVGRMVNIGVGVATANYDGEKVHRTVIEDHASIGAGSVLIAPIRIGVGARTGAGAVVTRDVPPGALVVGVPARISVKKTN